MWAPAFPPPIASAGLFSANWRATSEIFSADTPILSATLAGAKASMSKDPLPVSALAAALSPRPSEMITWAMLRARMPSIPGFTYTHSSALAPVMEKREST